jgi:ABC-type bacteriocin/lantibiotic exporter with double-glycine peptidase domain
MNPIHPWQRLTQLLRVDKREIGHIYLYALVGGAISLSVPLGVQAIINLISGGQMATSWGVLIAFVTIGVGFTGAMQVMQLALAENIQQRLFARSAFEFAYRIPRIKAEAVAGRYLPELVNRFFDTFTVQKGPEQAVARCAARLVADRALPDPARALSPLLHRLRFLLVLLLYRSSASQGSRDWPPVLGKQLQVRR